MIDETKLRMDLIQFIQGSLSLEEFEDRLVRMSWDMHRDSSASAVALASAIELRLAEHSCGHLSDEEMKKEFSILVSGATICPFVDLAEKIQTDNDVQFIDWAWNQSPAMPSVDTSRGMVFSL